MRNKRVLIFSAPSGAGKSTVVQYLLLKHKFLEFSVSATSRAPRGKELDGKDYFFLTKEEFERRIRAREFVEYEEVYPGFYYGTLKSEVARIWKNGNVILFDIDVMGGISLKKNYGDDALSVFLKPPSTKELRNRLEKRGTDSPEAVERRVAKAELELSFAGEFDVVLVNDNLETCLKEVEKIIQENLL